MIKTERQDNNFDFLRVFAAFLVIFGHSQSLIGVHQYGLWGHGIATIGVLIFFGLSGYLVTQSWQRIPSYFLFLIKRSLRIFPALFVCIILTSLILGPLLTALPLLGYFQNPSFQSYFSNLVLLPRYHLPGVYEGNIYPHAVNGSLWSLPVEFTCYLFIALVAFGREKINLFAVLLLIACIFTLNILMPDMIIWGSHMGSSTAVMPFFMTGAILCILRDKIPLRWDIATGCVLILVILSKYFPNFPVHKITWLLVPYVVLTIGWASTPFLRRTGRFGDPSYGMYLYAFPIQQTIIYLSENEIGFWSLTIWTTLISGVLGYISWKTIERPSMKLKEKLPKWYSQKRAEDHP